MFNEEESKEIKSLVKSVLELNGAGKSDKREALAGDITLLIKNYLAGRYSTKKKDPNNIGIHVFKPGPENYPK